MWCPGRGHRSTWSVLSPEPGPTPSPSETTNLPMGTMFCLDSRRFRISSRSLSRMAREGATLAWLDRVCSPVTSVSFSFFIFSFRRDLMIKQCFKDFHHHECELVCGDRPVAVHPQQTAPAGDVRVQLLQQLLRR